MSEGSTSNDWTNITRPAPGTLRWKVIEPGHPLRFAVGKDSDGAYIFQLKGNFDIDGTRDVPEFKALEVELKKDDQEAELLLYLRDPEAIDIFQKLCTDLRLVTEDLEIGDDQAGLFRILNRLKRWQKLLEASRPGVLGKSEIIGLHGELLLLQDLFLSRLSARDAVAAWRDEEQDFSHEASLVEVKTQGSAADSRLQISSEDQLDTDSGLIIVCHQTLAPAEAAHPDGRSLNALVEEINTRLSEGNIDARAMFETKLSFRKYEARPEYDRDIWLLSKRDYFNVEGDFPRLTPTKLPSGVERVRYHIRLETCTPFRVLESVVIEKVFGE